MEDERLKRHDPRAETRRCERCGKEFEPKRERARFFSARCRVAWNREKWNRANWGQQKRVASRAGYTCLAAWPRAGCGDFGPRGRLLRHGDSLSSCVVAGERANDVNSDWAPAIGLEPITCRLTEGLS